VGGDLLSATNGDRDRLVWPREWGAPLSISAWSVALGLGAVVLVTFALLATEGGDDSRVLVGLALLPALVALMILVIQTAVRRRMRSTAEVRALGRAETAEAGILLPYRRDVAILRLFITAWLALLGVVLLVGGLVLAGTTAASSAGLGAVLVGGAIIAVTMPVVAAVLRGRIRRGAVILTPEGVTHRSWTFDIETRWAEVIAVLPGGGRENHVLVTAAAPSGTSRSGRLTVRSKAWREPEMRLAPHVAIRVADVSVDPVLLLHTLRFYAERPDMRHELGSQAGVDRIRRGDVVV